MNTLFLDALEGKNHLGRPPVWLMRQAGRYMPEYQAIRKKHSFLTMAHTPELAMEVTLLPISSLGVDAAILFSDILVIPEAMGLPLRFEEGRGPIFDRRIQSEQDIDALPMPDSENTLSYVTDTIKLLLPELNVPLIGFSGAPFTLASYMIEGQSSKDLKKTRQLIYRAPKLFKKLLSKLTLHVIDYLRMQIKAGVQAIQIFDSWANFLSPELFEKFVVPNLRTILTELQDSNVPIIIFCRGSATHLSSLIDLHPTAISLDWSCELATARKAVPRSIALQGNIDPFLLYAPLPIIEKETTKVLQKMQNDPGYICNLGHGLLPDHNLEHVQHFVNTVQSFHSRKTAYATEHIC